MFSGKPALGTQETTKGECSERYLTCSAMRSGPVAQFRPKMSIGYGCKMARAALMSEPTNIVPVASIVTDTINGIRAPFFLNTSSMAFNADLICSRLGEG